MIKYLCTSCSKLVGLSGFKAINEVGRKFCEGCGDNSDWNLMVVDADECDAAIEARNKLTKEEVENANSR